MSGLARLTGIAKPMPVESRAIAVLMPMTGRDASRSGPPLLPGLIAASVWMRFRRFAPSVWIERPLAETMPLVTVFEKVPKRAADRDDELADAKRVRVAERRPRSGRSRRP